MFVDKFKGHFNCCILAAGKNTHSVVPTHTHTCEQGLDMMGFDVVGALWGVEEDQERGGGGRKRGGEREEGWKMLNKRRIKTPERLFMRPDLQILQNTPNFCLYTFFHH